MNCALDCRDAALARESDEEGALLDPPTFDHADLHDLALKELQIEIGIPQKFCRS